MRLVDFMSSLNEKDKAIIGGITKTNPTHVVPTKSTNAGDVSQTKDNELDDSYLTHPKTKAKPNGIFQELSEGKKLGFTSQNWETKQRTGGKGQAYSRTIGRVSKPSYTKRDNAYAQKFKHLQQDKGLNKLWKL